MLVWNDCWWKVVDFVRLQHKNTEGLVVGEQQGIVIVPTGPTAGAEKRYLAGRKKETRPERIRQGNVLPFETTASKRKAHNERVQARTNGEHNDA